MISLSSVKWPSTRLLLFPPSWSTPLWRSSFWSSLVRLLRVITLTLLLVLMTPHQNQAENRNSRTRLVAPLTPQDFLLAGIMDSPTHALMHGMLRLGYVYSLMLCAIDLKLQADNTGPKAHTNGNATPSREELLNARKVFSRLIQPFLVSYSVANNILGTTEASLLLLQQQIDYSMLRSH